MNAKEFLKREWLFWLLILTPLIFVLVKWDAFPDRVPTHWNVDGEVNEYRGKWALFISPVVNFGIYLMMLLVPRIDPRKKNYNLFGGAYWMIRVMIAALLSLLGVITSLAALGVKLDVGRIVESAVICLFLLLGNLFGKIRPNFFVGLRTPWTISNEEVWMKTHRFAGRLWVIASLLMLPLVFLLSTRISSFVFMAYIVVLVVLPIVYSWRLYKSLTKAG